MPEKPMDTLESQLKREFGTKYITRDEFETTVNSINMRIDGVYEAVKELKEVTREQNQRLIEFMRDNNTRMQNEMTKLLSTLVQSKNDIVKETLRSKDTTLRMQHETTTQVLKYELAKGGFAGLIISGFLLLLRVIGVL